MKMIGMDQSGRVGALCMYEDDWNGSEWSNGCRVGVINYLPNAS